MLQVVTAREAVRRGTLPHALLAGRALVSALILAALVGQLSTTLVFWGEQGYGDIPRNVTNYLSFFTVQSNLLAMVALGILVASQLGRPRVGRRFDVALLCTTTYMFATGIVYNVVMRDVELPQGATLEWSNEVLHLVAPVWMLLDWFLCPRERDLRWADLGTVLVFPLLWLGFTFLRAPKDASEASETPYWYPMLDPANHDNGVLGVVSVCFCIAAVLLVAAAVQLAFVQWRRLARR